MIKHLIFDFGGVFLDLGGKHTGVPSDLAKIFNIPEEKAVEIWKENKEGLMVGKENPEEFLMRISTQLGNPINIKEAHEDWKKLNEMEKDKIDWALVDYIESLKENYKIHMLTNVAGIDSKNSEWFDVVAKHFNNIYKSFEIGHKKPDKEAYSHVLEKINAKPEECVFVDDLKANVDAANELGIKGILYTNLDQLKEDFCKIKVLCMVKIARVIILNSEGKILILKRNLFEGHYPGLWDVPGGGMDEGETLKATAIREAREECGLEVEIKENYFTVFHRMNAPVDIYGFVGGVTKGNIVLSTEHTEFAWMSKDEWQNFELIPSSKVIVKAYIEKGL